MPYNLRPSGSNIWTRCSANPRISENAKRAPDESDAAREGTCAAWVADCVLKGDAHSCSDMLGETHTNGWIVDDEMVYFVQGYIDVIRSIGGIVNAEQHVRLTEFIAGTYDGSVLTTSEDTLHVKDLKYGYKLVDVYECSQLIIYGYAELMRLNNPNITHVVLAIYQPRAWHPDGIHRTWRMSVQELHQRASAIAAKGDLCQNPQAPATPGEHCEYCKGRLECATLTAANYESYAKIEAGRQGQMNGEELSNELTFLKRAKAMLDARMTAVHAEAEHRLKAGDFIRGWGQKERHGNRVFTVDRTTVRLLTGIDPFISKEMTPAQLEQAGADKKVVEFITKSPFIGYKLDNVTERDFGRMFRDQD